MLGKFISFLVGVIVTCAGAVLAVAFIPGAGDVAKSIIERLVGS